VVALVRDAPSLGAPYGGAKQEGLRRILLNATRFHVYFVYSVEDDQIEVRAVWSAIRGRGPRL
jgi:hypothetical protein